MDETPQNILPAFSSMLTTPPLRCTCGSAVFFDWGIKIIHQQSVGNSPRFQDFGSEASVKICASCHRALVVWDGDLYDASEYVSREDIDQIIEQGQVRKHAFPARVMDP